MQFAPPASREELVLVAKRLRALGHPLDQGVLLQLLDGYFGTLWPILRG